MRETVVQLREIVSLITKGTTPTTMGYPFVKKGINFVKAESISENFNFNVYKFEHITKECDDVLQRSRLKENDLLFSIAGVIGKVAVVTKTILPANTNQALAILRPIEEKVNPRFLAYILSSSIIYNQCLVKKNGVAQVNISLKNIGDFIIPLPPLEEQRAIAEKLDKVSQLVDKRKEQLQQLDQLVKSQFISFFGSTDLSDEKKSNVRIGDVAEIVGGSTPKTDIEEYWNGEYFWITPAELKDDSYMIKTTIRKLSKAGVESCSLKKMPVNTVLLSSRAPIGKVAITGVEMYCNQGFKNIICSNKLQPTFIYFLLKYNTKYLNSLGRGATFKEISKSIVENIKIPLPPMELQNQFAEFVEKVEKLKGKVNNSLTHLKLLKQSLMQQYFG